MVRFNDYTHFKRYCYATAKNKEVKLSKCDFKAFDDFEELYLSLIELDSQGKIRINKCILNELFNFLRKDRFEFVVNKIKFLNSRYDDFKDKKINFYDIYATLLNGLELKIEFTEDFISESNINDEFFPDRVRVYELLEESAPIYPVVSKGEDSTGMPGVYCIYGHDGNLRYVGRSTVCAKGRALVSVYEQDLPDFSRIELRIAKTKSDACVYEYYYINKLKPINNYDGNCDDALTVVLPELDVYETLVRDFQGAKHIEYIYGKRRVLNTKEVLNELGKTLVLVTDVNSDRYYGKHIRKGDAYNVFYKTHRTMENQRYYRDTANTMSSKASLTERDHK